MAGLDVGAPRRRSRRRRPGPQRRSPARRRTRRGPPTSGDRRARARRRARTSRESAAAMAISGPMPAGSPTVMAMRGRGPMVVRGIPDSFSRRAVHRRHRPGTCAGRGSHRWPARVGHRLHLTGEPVGDDLCRLIALQRPAGLLDGGKGGQHAGRVEMRRERPEVAAQVVIDQPGWIDGQPRWVRRRRRDPAPAATAPRAGASGPRDRCPRRGVWAGRRAPAPVSTASPRGAARRAPAAGSAPPRAHRPVRPCPGPERATRCHRPSRPARCAAAALTPQWRTRTCARSTGPSRPKRTRGQRDRTVSSSESARAVTSTNIDDGGGSSSVLSSAFWAEGCRLSAWSTTTTRRRASNGR